MNTMTRSAFLVAPQLCVLSLGAGVQSSTLALMAAHGEIGPMPDCAIFADTGKEPGRVYEHLRWRASGNVLPFPMCIISGGNLRGDLMRRGSVRADRFVRTVLPPPDHCSRNRGPGL